MIGYIAVFALGLTAVGAHEDGRLALLQSNETQRRAHLAGDAQLLTSVMDETMVSISKGELSTASREAIQARFAGYFQSVRYRSWDDMIPPLIRIADDGSLATMAVKKLIDMQGVNADGDSTARQFVQFVWDATYRRLDDGRWALASNASSQKPLSAEEASAARIALSEDHAVIDQPDLVPEGVAFDSSTGTTFVSSTYRRKIVAISADGAVRDFKSEGEDGLWSTLGMEVDEARRALWVVTANLHAVLPMRIPEQSSDWQSQLLRFDVDTGELHGRFGPELNGRVGLNDVCVTADGRVFVTESMQGMVLELDTESGALRELVLSTPMTFPNGITHDDQGVLYVSHRNGVRIINPATGDQREMLRPDDMTIERFDGLAWFQGRLIGNQPHLNRIVELTLADGGRAVESQRILEANHPAFDQPSTGEVAISRHSNGDRQAHFIFLANAQMRSAFQWRNVDAGIDATTLRATNELESILLLKVPLFVGDSPA